MNYDKDKLIEKIIDDVEDIDASSLLLKNFGELWDILIDDRTKKYKQTFKDKNYEQILTQIFNEMSNSDVNCW